MAVKKQEVTNRYAAYNGDCIEVLPELKEESVHVSIYSPPFAELYNYSSDDRDLSNCRNYDEFLKHYEFLISQIARVTIPGRISCVHCMDLRRGGGAGGMRDFPGDIIRMYERNGFVYHARHVIWKEPRRRRRVYRYDYDEHDHIRLLRTLCRLPCRVLISGYSSQLYDEMLINWNKQVFSSKTHNGIRNETIWFNFVLPTKLHDARFLGRDFRERQTVKRRMERLQRRVSILSPQEKHCLSEWLFRHLSSVDLNANL